MRLFRLPGCQLIVPHQPVLLLCTQCGVSGWPTNPCFSVRQRLIFASAQVKPICPAWAMSAASCYRVWGGQ